ncbi:MAG: SDR family oxidoreductase [Candidatus Kapabacteria bacterium]|nr:SDR family oxidoreductase [Candidatus Kapabacteria bacterium]
MNPTNIVIVGATSAIARAIAERYLTGSSFVLVARDADRASAIADDLTIRGAAIVSIVAADLADLADHARVVHETCAAMPSIDLVVIAHGVLPEQDRCDVDPDYAIATFSLNADSMISIMHRFVNQLIDQRQGTAVVISSVAGERGRASNYTYGAAKAAVTAYASGLRARAAAYGVRVITVKPGFVDTPMTSHLPKNPLFASADTVAANVAAAVRRGTASIYAPWFWRPVMALIRILPEKIFMKLKA